MTSEFIRPILYPKGPVEHRMNFEVARINDPYHVETHVEDLHEAARRIIREHAGE